MAQICPKCQAPVSEESMQCGACGSDLDPLHTIPAPGARGKAAPRASKAGPSPPRPARPARQPQPIPTAPPAPRPRPAVAARPPAPAVARDPRPVPPPATPGLNYPAQAPPGGAYPGAPAPAAAPGKFARWIIKKLGGDPAPPMANPYPPGPVYAYPQPTPIPPAPAPQPAAPPGWPDPAAYLPPTPAPAQPLQARPQDWPPAPSPDPGPPAAAPGGDDDDDGRTMGLAGVDIDKLNIPKYTYRVQILDSGGHWREWTPINPNGLNVGRAKSSGDFPGLSSMAVRHLRFSYHRSDLQVEDLGSLNGVYRSIAQPVELHDGIRFRIGGQVIEFHQAEPFEPVPAVRSDDGEEFCSRDLEPLAFLVLIRPNGMPGLRFPMTRLDRMIIGREGERVDVALTNDPWVSAPHAQVRHDNGKFFLEDMKSRNGTFVQIAGPTAVKSGDVLLVGRVLLRVVDQSDGGVG